VEFKNIKNINIESSKVRSKDLRIQTLQSLISVLTCCALDDVTIIMLALSFLHYRVGLYYFNSPNKILSRLTYFYVAREVCVHHRTVSYSLTQEITWKNKQLLKHRFMTLLTLNSLENR